MQLSLVMHRRNPGYEVKAVINFNSPGIPRDVQKTNLRELQAKLEKTIPGSFRAKYNATAEDLTIFVKADKAGTAQSAIRKLEDFINSAAMSLKLK
jgi:hypothetical protein